MDLEADHRLERGHGLIVVRTGADKRGVRRAILLTVTALIAVSAACVAPRGPEAPARLPDRIRVRVGDAVVALPIEDYVAGTILAEVSPVTETTATAERIFEVQAIVARTYAARHLGRHRAEGFDVCDTTHCQIYDGARLKTSRFAAIARTAAARTRGRVLVYGGRVADALFHADCGGATAAADSVWGGAPVPYLLARPDDIGATHRTWSVNVERDRLRNMLDADPRSDIGQRLDNVEVRQRDASGRAATVALSGELTKLVRGEDFRAILNRVLGDRALQSTRLTVTRRGTAFAFAGSGFGHGVGLCQVGAAARARRGDSVEQILAAYYPGTALSR